MLRPQGKSLQMKIGKGKQDAMDMERQHQLSGYIFSTSVGLQQQKAMKILSTRYIMRDYVLVEKRHLLDKDRRGDQIGKESTSLDCNPILRYRNPFRNPRQLLDAIMDFVN